jgi:DNA-binding transcriptional LysR family regulator
LDDRAPYDDSSVNLRFIETFVWVARLRSFTAAAEKLYTTQAAISARIATLEEDFGVKLFERDKRTVTLTPSGEELLKYAEELLGISARMLQAVSDRATFGGFISIGVIEAVVHTWLPDLLSRLRQQFPKVRVEIHSYITADLHEELLNGNIDLALAVETLENPTIQNNPICAFKMEWIAAPSTSRDPALSGAERLNRLPILTFLRGSLVYRDVVAKLGPYCVARINPISSIAAMVSLVRTGYGVATLPCAAIAPALGSGELIALDGVPELAPLPVIASTRRQSESPLAAAVVHLAVEAAQWFSTAGRSDLLVVDSNRI